MKFERASSLREDGKCERATYTLESGVTVELGSVLFQPRQGAEESGGKAMVFLPGWAMSEKDRGARDLTINLAEEFKCPSYAISSRSVERGREGLELEFIAEEASAIAKFIKDHGIKEVNLAGYSLGADRTARLAAAMQKDSSIDIKSLTLINPLGLHGETTAGRVGRFAKHSLMDTPISLMRSLDAKKIATGVRVLGATIENIATEIWRSGPTYPKRLMNEIKEMTAVNPYLRELRMPIVIVLGDVDPVSDRERIMPAETEKQIRNVLGEKLREADVPLSGRDKTLASREAFLKENLVPNSPYVRLVVAKKAGYHTLPHFRPESVARASAYLLRRYERDKDRETSAES